MLGGNTGLNQKSLIDGFENFFKSVAEKIYSIGKSFNFNTLLKELKTEFKGISKLTSSEINKAVEEGFGEILQEADKVAVDSLKKSVNVFSGFKTYKELKVASELLLNEKGEIRTFKEFLKDIKQLNANYNSNYLRSEYNNAIGSAQIARIWQEAQENKEDYNLMFDAVLDKRTRPTHAALDGIVRPVDDAFWDIYMPLLDWNCRCLVRLILKGSKKISKVGTFTGEELSPMFRTNTAKSGIIFPDTHPYYETSQEERKQIIQLLK